MFIHTSTLLWFAALFVAHMAIDYFGARAWRRIAVENGKQRDTALEGWKKSSALVDAAIAETERRGVLVRSLLTVPSKTVDRSAN